MTSRRPGGIPAGLCLGIDPHAPLLTAWGLPDTADGAREFGLRSVEAAVDVVAVVKPQVAFFERFGAAGYQALETVLAAARAAGLWTIADGKRGDIGSTVAGYAAAWLLPGSPLEADAATFVAYQGTGSLEPAFQLAEAHGKQCFVLAATSNPEAAELQRARTASGVSVAAEILGDVQSRNDGLEVDAARHGVVIGATIDAEHFGLDLAAAPTTPILAPGFGAQGARLRELRARYGVATDRVIANVARDALRAGPDGLRARLIELRDECATGVAA
ncbi:MAG TPA: orotidine-5'-phosphate decarboxylase [Microbacteriaceae bacterium]|nr:orotidine-5'-phosphate decarboxylase [Microbacteriaceae bacterium]